jgi:hypothetical protein
MAFAISRVIEKVVVVVVVITREGSLGSGPRFDWENLREARFAAASSLGGRIRKRKGRKEKGDARGERIWEGPKELFVCRELEGDDEGCEEIEGVLEGGGVGICAYSWSKERYF